MQPTSWPQWRLVIRTLPFTQFCVSAPVAMNVFVVCYHSNLISDPPNTTLTPDSITTNETYNVTYYCETFGIPKPNITWVNASSEAEVAGDIDITPGSKDHFSGFPITTSTLTIFNAKKEDETNYTCVAINNVLNLLDTPENVTASLIVQGI